MLKNAALARFEAGVATLKPLSDAVALEQGKQSFVNLCAPCHRADGGGLVGPNLCDAVWIHGSNYVDTVKVIINGVTEKGMLSWRGFSNLPKSSRWQATSTHCAAAIHRTPSLQRIPPSRRFRWISNDDTGGVPEDSRG